MQPTRLSSPTDSPTHPPTDVPTESPTSAPSAPTESPTDMPTAVPSDIPTHTPTATPTAEPTALVCTAAGFGAAMAGCVSQGNVCQSEVNAVIGNLGGLKTAFGCDESVGSACLDFIVCSANAAQSSGCPASVLPPKLRRLKFVRDRICNTTTTDGASDVCTTSPCAPPSNGSIPMAAPT